MKIYKFPVPLEDIFTIDMPIDSKILSFQEQKGNLVLWTAFWPNSSREQRKFTLVGTGHDIDMDLVKQYIGTAQLFKGDYIWHLFELT